MKKSSSLFIIHFNEISNKQMKKQLGIKTRFWPETDSAVKVHHLHIQKHM